MAKKKETLTLEEKLENALVPGWEQPYEIPSNWVWTSVDEVCKLANGVKRDNEELPYLEVKYLRGKIDGITKDKGNYIGKGSKVILVDGENSGEVFHIFENGYMGSTFKKLNVTNFVDLQMFEMFLAIHKDKFRNSKTGSAIPHLNKELFRQIPFPIPPIAEQQRIVNKIESLFSKLDEAKELTQKALDSFNDRKSAILHKAFSGELTKKWREENGVGFESWEETLVGEICDSIVPGRDKPLSFTGNIPWITTPCITGEYINSSSAEYYLTQQEIDEVKSKVIPTGSVVMTCVGRFGVAAITECKCVINQQLHAFLPSEIIINIFLRYNIEYLKDYMSEKSTSTTVAYLNKTSCNSLPIHLPTLPEQTEIVRILDNLLENETKAKEFADVIEKIDLIKKSILGKAFRGKLGTNDASEESALGLLREILEEE